MKRLLPIVLCFVVLLSGCSLFHRKPAATKTPSKSQRHARAEKWMQTSIDSELAREKQGERPSAGRKTWREYWDWRISLWRKDKNKKFEPYLAQRRKALGLPSVKRL